MHHTCHTHTRHGAVLRTMRAASSASCGFRCCMRRSCGRWRQHRGLSPLKAVGPQSFEGRGDESRGWAGWWGAPTHGFFKCIARKVSGSFGVQSDRARGRSVRARTSSLLSVRSSCSMPLMRLARLALVHRLAGRCPCACESLILRMYASARLHICIEGTYHTSTDILHG